MCLGLTDAGSIPATSTIYLPAPETTIADPLEPSQVNHGLSARQLELVCAILATKAAHITGVNVFGSRATGRWRPESDLDLVLHGDLSEKDISRLWTLFDESSLPFSVDIKSHDLTTYPPLKQHMDQVRRPLFTADQLQAAAGYED